MSRIRIEDLPPDTDLTPGCPVPARRIERKSATVGVAQWHLFRGCGGGS